MLETLIKRQELTTEDIKSLCDDWAVQTTYKGNIAYHIRGEGQDTLIIPSFKCAWYDMARIQRQNERARGLDDTGTDSFKFMGCYNCDGFNKECKTYYIPKVKNDYFK